MTGTPWFLAFLMPAAADGLSRLTISSTVAPPLSIWSAIVANFALSPLAFWMSDLIPAAVKASPRNLRSAVSHRAEDAVSGRITPILAFDAESDPDDDDPLPELLPPLLSLPHAATVSAAAVNRAAPNARLLINFPFLLGTAGQP